MKHPTPTRRDHQRFCEIEGWTKVRDARGRTGSHHLTYELTLPDGRTLRTRVSHPPNRTDIRRGLFAHILRDQLVVTEDEFWECVSNGDPPDRGMAARPSGEPLPPEVVHLLVSKVGLPDDEVRRLSKAEALAILNDYWSRPDS